jgi:NAD(P) transhydrogenase subunit beta
VFESLGDSGIPFNSWLWIIAGSIVGTFFGAVVAKKVAMTAMPETVALFNGCGGMSSLLVALAVAIFPLSSPEEALNMDLVEKISIVISVFVGSITFTGSIVAMAKLQGWLPTPAWMQSKIRHFINIGLGVVSLVSISSLLSGSDSGLLLLVISSALLGVGVTLPIGGADH